MQHLFRQIIPDRKVLWVNSINHRIPRLSWYDAKRALQKLGAMTRPAVPPTALKAPSEAALVSPAAVLTPRVLPWYNLRTVRALNRLSLGRDLRYAAQHLFGGETPVVVVGTPVIGHIVRDIEALARVYFCMDDYGELPGVDRGLIAPLERQFVSEVDAVIATAQHLVETRRPPSGRSFQLPQGVNHEHFSTPLAIPADLARLSSPRIGFAGGVSSGCDQDILLSLADAFPTGSIVLIGPVTIDVSRLARPNIHVLGPRAYAELPAYVQHFDVGIINYLLNDWMRAVDPLKLLEYLSAGIPVVSTDLPEVRKYADHVRIARDGSLFVQACREAIQERTPVRDAARKTFASQHTWGARARTFLERISETCEATGHGRFR